MYYNYCQIYPWSIELHPSIILKPFFFGQIFAHPCFRTLSFTKSENLPTSGLNISTDQSSGASCPSCPLMDKIWTLAGSEEMQYYSILAAVVRLYLTQDLMNSLVFQSERMSERLLTMDTLCRMWSHWIFNEVFSSDLHSYRVALTVWSEFWDLGHELYKSTPRSFPVLFILRDAFDANFLVSVPPFCVSAIHTSSFFHLSLCLALLFSLFPSCSTSIIKMLCPSSYSRTSS